MKSEWTEAAANSAKDVAAMFGFERCDVSGQIDGMPRGLGGAFVPLVGDRMSVQFGLLADPPGQRTLTRTVLQMEPEEEVDAMCVTDALGELANCIVGKIKSALRAADPSLRIGLPMFIDGTVEQIRGAQYTTLQLKLDSVEVSMAMAIDLRG